jgi:sigma-E factor negative regulatory protein RseB
VKRALVLLLLLALPLQVLAANAWLTRIGPALRGLDYRGTLVVVADGRMETLRVFHRNDEGRERERLVALSGPPRELVRDGERVVCVGTGGGDAAYPLDGEGHWRAAIALGEGVATEAYDIALGGQGRVAGYPAQILEVRAGDRWRYGYRLWLEQDSGLPLRVDLLDAGGRAVERVAFTELELGVQPSDEELSPSAAVTPVPTRRASPLPPESVGWLVRSPPPGFVLRAARSQDGGAHLLYSDGLASVSVYVEPAPPGLRGSDARRRGAVHSRTFWADGWRVLAIGKVPAGTVDRFARNLSARDDG